MTKRYLFLVLVEVPDYLQATPYVHWFYAVSVEQAKLRDGMLELVYCDGTIKVFNPEETEEILLDCGELLNKFLWENDFNLNEDTNN